jgi:excinuclease UvrABC nuclease subunit
VLAVEDLYPALAEHGLSHFEVGPPPPGPGVYVWDSNGSALYIGSAKSLQERLGGYRR